MDDMGRFLNQQNIERYRRLLDSATDPDQRRMILELLTGEEQRLARQIAKVK